jgi:hypothetical protein
MLVKKLPHLFVKFNRDCKSKGIPLLDDVIDFPFHMSKYGTNDQDLDEQFFINAKKEPEFLPSFKEMLSNTESRPLKHFIEETQIKRKIKRDYN